MAFLFLLFNTILLGFQIVLHMNANIEEKQYENDN